MATRPPPAHRTATAIYTPQQPLETSNLVDDDLSLHDFETHSPGLSRRSPSPPPPPLETRAMSSSMHQSVGLIEDQDLANRQRLPSPGYKLKQEEVAGMTDSEEIEAAVSHGGYSPPAWRRLGNGSMSSGFWKRHGDEFLSRDGFRGGFGAKEESVSRGVSPAYESLDEGEDEDEDEDEVDRASRIRLPTGSLSPGKAMSPEVEEGKEEEERAADEALQGDVADAFFRFSVSAQVQQRTEPIESLITTLRTRYKRATKTWTSLLTSLFVVYISFTIARFLISSSSSLPALATDRSRPVPDLIKVARIARSFEPLIHFSEGGQAQVNDLQATGVAVWDLGESVRISNLTSGPVIVKELEGLSDSLKVLAEEMTRFFANVDGDVDGILIVVDWARRELTHLAYTSRPSLTSSPLTTISSTFHSLLHHTLPAMLFENPSTHHPTQLSHLTTSLLGPSPHQTTLTTLARTFHEFLGVLEEAISSELTHSLALFSLFESIDRQFLNLARSVARETSRQEDSHSETLSSLWVRILGPDRGQMRKYESNRKLLGTVHNRTIANKLELAEHNQRLLALKANLESLRRKLVSPLMRGAAGGNGDGGLGGGMSYLSLEEQIKGLEDVGGYLEGVRMRQKGRMLERLYGAGSRRVTDGIEGKQ